MCRRVELLKTRSTGTWLSVENFISDFQEFLILLYSKAMLYQYFPDIWTVERTVPSHDKGSNNSTRYQGHDDVNGRITLIIDEKKCETQRI